MEGYTRAEQLGIFEGQMILTRGEIADLMAEEEQDLENLEDENKIAVIKERLEKYEEVLADLRDAEGTLAELKEQLEC